MDPAFALKDNLFRLINMADRLIGLYTGFLSREAMESFNVGQSIVVQGPPSLMTFKNKMTIYSFTIRHSFPNLLYVTYLHDVLYVCATSILFLFSQRDHNENKVYPDLYYAIPATVS